jgi:hypothetical protein
MILSLNTQSNFTTSFWLGNPLLLKQNTRRVWFGINIVFTQYSPSSKSQHVHNKTSKLELPIKFPKQFFLIFKELNDEMNI